MRTAMAIAVAGLLAHSATALDLPEVKQRGTLRVLFVGDPGVPVVRPHFLAEQNKNVVGLEGEILLSFARVNGLKLELVYVPSWDVLIPSMLQKKGDLIAGGVTDTPERRKLVDFTVETFPTRDVVVTLKPHRIVQTIRQLREERVGVPRGTSFIEALRAAGVRAESTVTYGSAESAMDALSAGAITATVQGVDQALAPQVDDPDLQIGMFLGPPQSLALAVRKEDRQLLAALNQFIGNVRKTATWSRLVVKYFGDNAIVVLKRARTE